jgi:hypothetical protein
MQPPESEGRSVVLIGSFNPAIFQPMWFVKTNLLDEKDAKSAENNARITPDIAFFSIESGFQLQLEVLKSRLAATSRNPACWADLHDLITQTFEILEHTPIRQLGINRDVHYRISSEDRWQEIGDILAPKRPWHMLVEPKTQDVVIKGQRRNSEAEYVQTNVRPSALFPGERVLEIRTNEHYAWESEVPAKEVTKVISKNWDDAYQFSKELGESIFSARENNE